MEVAIEVSQQNLDPTSTSEFKHESDHPEMAVDRRDALDRRADEVAGRR